MLKKTNILSLLALALSIPLTALAEGASPVSIQARLNPEQLAANASNQFGWTVFNRIRAESEKKTVPENLLFSPLSAWLVLTMSSNGANAETLTEMKSVLGLGKDPINDWNLRAQALTKSLRSSGAENDETLHIANSIWVDSERFELSPQFRMQANTFYSILPDQDLARDEPFSDPKTLQAMNNWVEESTGGMIPTILEKFEDDTVAVLLNALFFQGQWDAQFSRDETSAEPFYLGDGRMIQADTLRHTDLRTPYVDDGTFKMMSLRFRSLTNYGRYQLDFVLPSKKTASLNSFSRDNYDQLQKSQRSTKVNLVKIPKFKLDFTQSMRQQLQALGMKRVFSKTAQLDKLGRTFASTPIFFTDVLQKTAVEMDENGFKAAAVTAVIIAETVSAEIEPDDQPYVEFIADEPFFFSLRDTKTGSILFQGILNEPQFK